MQKSVLKCKKIEYFHTATRSRSSFPQEFLFLCGSWLIGGRPTTVLPATCSIGQTAKPLLQRSGRRNGARESAWQCEEKRRDRQEEAKGEAHHTKRGGVIPTPSSGRRRQTPPPLISSRHPTAHHGTRAHFHSLNKERSDSVVFAFVLCLLCSFFSCPSPSFRFAFFILHHLLSVHHFHQKGN